MTTEIIMIRGRVEELSWMHSKISEVLLKRWYLGWPSTLEGHAKWLKKRSKSSRCWGNGELASAKAEVGRTWHPWKRKKVIVLVVSEQNLWKCRKLGRWVITHKAKTTGWYFILNQQRNKYKNKKLSPDGWKAEQDHHMLYVSEIWLPTLEPQRMPLPFICHQGQASVHKWCPSDHKALNYISPGMSLASF